MAVPRRSAAIVTTHRAIEAVWRIESARVIAGLARLVHDLGTAEELAQDALVAALEQWPDSGVPDNPGAWLMAVGKRRAIDLIRRNERLEQKQGLFSPTTSRSTPRPGPPPLPYPVRTRALTTTSGTTCFGWSSPPATRCCPPRLGSR